MGHSTLDHGATVRRHSSSRECLACYTLTRIVCSGSRMVAVWSFRRCRGRLGARCPPVVVTGRGFVSERVDAGWLSFLAPSGAFGVPTARTPSGRALLFGPSTGRHAIRNGGVLLVQEILRPKKFYWFFWRPALVAQFLSGVLDRILA